MNKEMQSSLLSTKEKAKETKVFFEKLKRKKPNNLDGIIQNLHNEVFEKIDCMTCANCCKTTSPIFRESDIERIANHLKIKVSVFIDKYLHKDDANDYVLKQAPCSFLATDNTCTIYNNRPLACKEYPHTNRKRFYQVLDLTLKNTTICPAVAKITEKLKTYYI
jgi:uncharacterized protein